MECDSEIIINSLFLKEGSMELNILEQIEEQENNGDDFYWVSFQSLMDIPMNTPVDAVKEISKGEGIFGCFSREGVTYFGSESNQLIRNALRNRRFQERNSRCYCLRRMILVKN